jgi:hypothetical protein
MKVDTKVEVKVTVELEVQGHVHLRQQTVVNV